MDRRPKTLIGESLRKKLLIDDPIPEVLDRMCSSPSSDSASVSLSHPDPYQCQIPLERVTSRCREYCRRAMSERALQCQDQCRRYVKMTDPNTGESYSGFGTLVSYLLDPTGDMLRVTMLVPLVSRMAERMTSWPFLGRDHDIFDNWSTYGCPNPLKCNIENITFTTRDTRVYDSVPGYRAEAYFSLWDPLGKHANVFGELNLILHLGFQVDRRVGIPRGFNVENPRARRQQEFALAGDMSQASRHPLVPRAFPFPAPIALHGPRRRPAPKLVRTPILNALHTRANVYEGEGPTKRRRRTQ